MSKRQRRTYSKGFKQQMVVLYNARKPHTEITQPYELSPFTFDRWVKHSKTVGSFKEKDNLTLV